MRTQYVNIISRKFLAIPLTLVLLCANDSCNLNSDWSDHYENAPERVSDNVLDLIGSDEKYSRFYDALMEYGFDELLSKNQYFTIFVPVNSAFEGLPDFTAKEWNRILGFHILYSKLFSHQFSKSKLLTIMGKYLEMEKSENDDVSIFESRINMNMVDMHCQNGVIHEIDKLMLPKPNVYEYIMDLDTSFSIVQDFLLSLDEKYVDYENSERIGVDDNGNAIYDTVWRTENYYLDNILNSHFFSENKLIYPPPYFCGPYSKHKVESVQCAPYHECPVGAVP